MGFITNKIYICLPFEKEIDKLDWNGLSTEEYNGKTYYKIPSGGSSSDVVKKITFETLKDNVTVTLNIVSSSEQSFDFAYACELDGPSGYSNAKYKISGNNQSITCEYVVPTKGSHWIYIGYRKDGSGSYYNDCGYFFIDDIDKEYVIGQPKEVYLASNKMKEITYGSKKILERKLGNTISWETLQWTKSGNNNSYTYNTKEKLKISYNNKYAYLTNSPASIATKMYQLKFYNINDYYNYGPYSTYNCTYKLDLSDLETSNITNMNSMFSQCKVLTSVNVANWHTSKVTNIGSMFTECTALTSVNVTNWDTSKVTNAIGMFGGCKSLTSLDLSGWDTSSISEVCENDDNGGMFENCENLVDLKLPKNFITSKVTSIRQMFKGCKSLTSLDLSGWDTSNIEHMNDLFKECGIKIIDLSNWDFSNLNIQNQKFGWMFYLANCETIILPNIKKYKNLDKCAFRYIKNLKYFYANELVNSNVFDIDSLFSGDINLISVDMADWDFSNITKASSMFYNCSSLATLINEHEHEPDVMAFKGMKISIDLHYSTKLNYESVYALFRGVATVTTTQTITLPKVMEGNLDSAKVKIAIDKGWTVAYK